MKLLLFLWTVLLAFASPIDAQSSNFMSYFSSWLRYRTANPILTAISNTLITSLTIPTPSTLSTIMPARQVAIVKKDQNDNVYVCGGALVGTSHIVTLAHCIEGYAPRDLRIRSRKTEFDPHVEKDVISVIIHPEYYRGNLSNDIAVIKFEGAIDFDYKFKTADGVKHEEEGAQKKIGEESGDTSRGSWSYTALEREKIELTFVADENGFQPQGAHLPVAPEPSPAKRALAVIARKNATRPAPRWYEHQAETSDARPPLSKTWPS